jgi:hypothetical protein
MNIFSQFTTLFVANVFRVSYHTEINTVTADVLQELSKPSNKQYGDEPINELGV